MRAKYLKGWLVEAGKKKREEVEVEKTPAVEGTTAVPDGTGGEGKEVRRGTTPVEVSNWERLVDIFQTAFRLGRLVEENMWQTVVLIPKGEGDYCDIGLVELMWKVVAENLNCRLTSSITFHDFLHGFWASRGTDTATLEAKLLQQLEALREEFLYMIFLDLKKAYDAFYRSRCLNVLER